MLKAACAIVVSGLSAAWIGGCAKDELRAAASSRAASIDPTGAAARGEPVIREPISGPSAPTGGAGAAGTRAGGGTGGSAPGVLAVGPADAGAANPKGFPALEAAMEDYMSWARRTPQPVSISAEIFTLCRLPTAAEQAFLDSAHGDTTLALLDWLNKGALQGFTAAQEAFPVGAAIVKEKLKIDASGQRVLAALGIMIKHERGFDPARDDWQFGYWEPEIGLRADHAEVAACADCHASSATDYVFVDSAWRAPRPP